MPKQLVITADDFGLSPGVNAAVEKAWQHGILTHASIMAGGTAFDQAVKIARRNPGLQVGLHLTLVQGSSVLPHARIPDLVNASGAFADNPVAAGMKYYFNKNLYKQLRNEIEAQIQKVTNSGIQLSHIDGHLNIHLHPAVFVFLAELMPQYNITSFRLSRERLFHNLRFNKSRIAGKCIERIIFGSLSNNALSKLKSLGIQYAREVKGVLNSGCMTETYLLKILNGLTEGLTEIYFHPGILPDTEISRRMPDYLHQDELAALLSPAVKSRLMELNIELRNYRGDIKSYV